MKRKKERIWSMYLTCLYENKTMNPVKIVLRRGEED
jgi:hypothetical protein